MAMLKVSNLRKEYDAVVAVDGVSLEVQRGELFGLLGPNGAGKTTTIRTVLNIIQPDSGSITFDDKPFTPAMWNIIGYLPEERGLYRKSKIINTILYFASLKGVPEKEAKPLAYQWMERFGLKDSGNRKVEELSKGNQQKIQLIISILHRPQLLILDEPFSGLDPVNQILLKDILLEFRKQNVAIVFSTHQMEQVEKMCDNICLINKGKPVLSGALSDVKKKYGTNSIKLEYEGDGTFLKSLPFVRRADVYQNYAELELTDIQKSGEILSKLDNKLNLRKFEVVEPSLNSIFINVVGVPAEAEKPVVQTPITAPINADLVSKDSRVKMALYTVVGAVLLTLVFAVMALMDSEFSWKTPGTIAFIALASLYGYYKKRKEVIRELELKREVTKP
ncbi:MAG: ATP-binding cassette domain-containing protein [Ignavibacteriales bacterium]|nr:ATP-binding cassette domain-containing protein [Ignavibacteriales bacterium]